MSGLGLNVPRAVSLRQQVTDSLRASIISGTLPPGQKLIEREICEEMRISRTVLREALQHLEAEGMIVNVPPRGRSVVAITPKEIREILSVRRAIEALLISDFRRNASESQVVELRRRLDDLETANEDETMAIEDQISTLIMDVSGNRTASDMLAQLNNRIVLSRRLSRSDPMAGAKRQAELRAFLAAVDESKSGVGDAKRASR
ncbi:GntR family transcriptional regulator [Rhizobium sp. P32RR-XVIII]|uniref:GntR family transcriptional regulator n=1 Tax=Rhizobium sp. P32RR-XVIII TaxID=2726738 RepID=UPI001456B8DB|nr:GntR family transcriptional regulator [Rhizobium sp. P32RR-XVIII]NLS03968.1 GntR family transcriptional regulator [Rhizobium sp. P32RR-XVIII]